MARELSIWHHGVDGLRVRRKPGDHIVLRLQDSGLVGLDQHAGGGGVGRNARLGVDERRHHHHGGDAEEDGQPPQEPDPQVCADQSALQP